MKQNIDVYCFDVIRQYDDVLNIIQHRFEAGKSQDVQTVAKELRKRLRKEMRILRISFKKELREVRKSKMQNDAKERRTAILKRYFEKSVDLKSKYFQRHLQDIICQA